MTQQLLSIIGQYGLTIVFFNVLVEQIGLPVPAIPTLVIAGALAADGQLPPAALFFWSLVACLMADCGWYLIGQTYGIRVLKLLCRISLEPDSCVSQTQTRFERWGINSLVVAKFIPGLAIIAPPLAGAMRIGWGRFIALSASVLDAPVSSVVSASFLPAMPPPALISSTANSTPLRACVPSSARLPVRAVVRPNGIGEGQLAASAFDCCAVAIDRKIAATAATGVLKDLCNIGSLYWICARAWLPAPYRAAVPVATPTGAPAARRLRAR